MHARDHSAKGGGIRAKATFIVRLSTCAIYSLATIINPVQTFPHITILLPATARTRNYHAAARKLKRTTTVTVDRHSAGRHPGICPL